MVLHDHFVGEWPHLQFLLWELRWEAGGAYGTKAAFANQFVKLWPKVWPHDPRVAKFTMIDGIRT